MEATNPTGTPHATPARSGVLTIDRLELGGAGIGLETEVLDPACMALVHVHKVHGLPLQEPQGQKSAQVTPCCFTGMLRNADGTGDQWQPLEDKGTQQPTPSSELNTPPAPSQPHPPLTGAQAPAYKAAAYVPPTSGVTLETCKVTSITSLL